MAGRSGPAASAAAAAAAAARSPTGLILLASLLGCSELVDGWNCQAEFGDNCQVRSGPQANQSYEEWVSHYRAWRAEGRAAFNFSAFDTPGVSWARTSFVQPQAMLHDRYLYDRSTHKWTVDKFLDDLTTRYGGINSVLLWQFYPNVGIDSRNNFDYIDSLPGGKAAAKQLVADFHRHGVKVLWPYFPWDVGTNNTGQPQYVSQIAWMKELGADGFNGDTVRGINISFWHEAISQHTPLVMEPEIMGNKGQKWTGTGLSTNVMSWGYWPYQKTPVVDAFKTLEPRHMTHISERWATDRTDGLHHAFFNGIGCAYTPHPAPAPARCSCIRRAACFRSVSPARQQPLTVTRICRRVLGKCVGNIQQADPFSRRPSQAHDNDTERPGWHHLQQEHGVQPARAVHLRNGGRGCG